MKVYEMVPYGGMVRYGMVPGTGTYLPTIPSVVCWVLVNKGLSQNELEKRV